MKINHQGTKAPKRVHFLGTQFRHQSTLANRSLQLFQALTWCLGALVVCLFCCPAYAASGDIPSVSDAELEQALALSGSNRPELQEALDYAAQKPFAVQAMRFVLVSLPLADLGSITGEELIEHFELASAARSEMACVRSMPAASGSSVGYGYSDAVWAHYVLPPRVSQEPLSAWRPYFYGELLELVKDIPSMETAALEVSKWCATKVRFVQTQRRDQGPLSTLASGFGRCEELCIFYIDACRAVGIPARMAYCPWWSITDNNHAWVEVYAEDGRFHYTGGCEPAPTLDNAWFGESAKQCSIVISPCFGLPQMDSASGRPMVDGMEVLSFQSTVGARFCQINTTPYYRQTSRLSVQLEPLADGSLPKAVYVHVYNYGCMRQVAKVSVNEQGFAGVLLGPGTYTLTAEGASGPHSMTVKLGFNDTVSLHWPSPYGQAERELLHFPKDPQ